MLMMILMSDAYSCCLTSGDVTLLFATYIFYRSATAAARTTLSSVTLTPTLSERDIVLEADQLISA